MQQQITNIGCGDKPQIITIKTHHKFSTGALIVNVFMTFPHKFIYTDNVRNVIIIIIIII